MFFTQKPFLQNGILRKKPVPKPDKAKNSRDCSGYPYRNRGNYCLKACKTVFDFAKHLDPLQSIDIRQRQQSAMEAIAADEFGNAAAGTADTEYLCFYVMRRTEIT